VRNRNRRIEEKEEELEAEQAINYFSTRMTEHQSIDDLLWDVAKNCIGRLQFEDCAIYLMDEERSVLVQKAAHGPKSPERFQLVHPIEIKIGQGITGKVAETSIEEIIEDTSRDERYIIDDVRRFSEITVPMIANGKVLGL
jgi:putative methionine-R-sulfoxide reductase with GAF domain